MYFIIRVRAESSSEIRGLFQYSSRAAEAKGGGGYVFTERHS